MDRKKEGKKANFIFFKEEEKKRDEPHRKEGKKRKGVSKGKRGDGRGAMYWEGEKGGITEENQRGTCEEEEGKREDILFVLS